MFPDTCEIEEGEKGQFELFQNGESFMKAGDGKFFDLENVKEKCKIVQKKLDKLLSF